MKTGRWFKRVAGLWPVLMALFGLYAAEPLKPADNARCLTCHQLFKTEKLTTRHARAGIGCSACHGDSEPHASDSSHMTAPQILFPRSQINPSCLGCHETPKLPAANPDHRDAWPDVKSAKLICTDCHGKHHLPARTVRWDKSTRALLPSK